MAAGVVLPGVIDRAEPASCAGRPTSAGATSRCGRCSATTWACRWSSSTTSPRPRWPSTRRPGPTCSTSGWARASARRTSSTGLRCAGRPGWPASWATRRCAPTARHAPAARPAASRSTPPRRRSPAATSLAVDRPVRPSADVVAAQGIDPIASAVWTDAVDALGVALAAATLLLDPARIVLGGGLAAAGDALVSPVAAALAGRLTWRPAPPVVGRRRSGLDAGVRGAALLASSLRPLVAAPSGGRDDRAERRARRDPGRSARPGLGRGRRRPGHPGRDLHATNGFGRPRRRLAVARLHRPARPRRRRSRLHRVGRGDGGGGRVPPSARDDGHARVA